MTCENSSKSLFCHVFYESHFPWRISVQWSSKNSLEFTVVFIFESCDAIKAPIDGVGKVGLTCRKDRTNAGLLSCVKLTYTYRHLIKAD